MTVAYLVLAGLLAGKPGFNVVDKMSLSAGQEVQIHTLVDTTASQDSTLVFKVGEARVPIGSRNIAIGKYRIAGKNISAWVFNRYDSNRIFLVGTHLKGKAEIEYLPADFPADVVNWVVVPAPSSQKATATKSNLNEKAVVALVLIGGGMVAGGVAGTLYAAENGGSTNQGAGIGGMVAGMGLGLVAGSLLYLQFVFQVP